MISRHTSLIRLAITVSLISAGAAAGAADLVLYDEDAPSQWSQMDRAVETADAAFEGQVGIRLTPTYWHKPLLRIAAGRTDFRPFDTLEFEIRATTAPMDQSLVAWDYAMGSWVRLSDYVDGGTIDTQWRHVSIPIADLASDAFPLDRVFVLLFDKMSAPQSFDIDNMVLRQLDGPEVLGHELPSDRALTIRCDKLDHDAIGDPNAFLISSATDPAYRTPRSPLAVGSARSAVDAGEDGGVTVESRVHLLLPERLLVGHSYRLSLAGVVDDNGNAPSEESLTITPSADVVSLSIQVNQVGYAPVAPKLAYIGNWLGDLGPMPVDATDFGVVDVDSGETIFEGVLSLRAAADPQSGADLYEADFSGLSTPGTYRVEVPGLGNSLPFEVAETVYDPVYRTVARLLYHKRNTRIEAPFADPGFERDGVDPLLDGVFHPILSEYALSVGEMPFGIKEIRGGWFDAGDYGLYMHNAAPIWGAIGLAFDLSAPGHFADDELGIPESGNGIPDLLDELGWGMDWALSMQDPSDGGVYWRLCSANWDWGMPSGVSEPRLIYEKTTRATAELAAMGAIYARLIAPYDAQRAMSVLDAGRAAWQFLQSHPSYPPEGQHYQNPAELPGGGTYSVSTSLPDQLWAAAELYRTTGELAFQDAYRDLRARANIDISGAPTSTFAFWAMAMTDHDGRDVLEQEEARRAIMIAADQKLDWAEQHPYRVPKHPSIQYSGWHSVSGSVMVSLALFQAYHLSGEPTYAELAWLTPGMTLGANPLSRSFISGVGARLPQDPLDRISLSDDVDAPVRGMPVPGFTWHLPGFREPYIGVNAAYYPPEQPVDGDYGTAYPVLRRYIDSHALIPMNEGTIREAGLTAVAFGLMRDGSSPPTMSATPYDWEAGHPKSGKVYALKDIPLADVPLLTPEQITAFGANVGIAPTAWSQALTPAQAAAIDAPTIPYWVGKLDPESAEALTAEQIAAFQQWSLFTALPPSKVALIPPAAMPGLGVEVRNTSQAWKEALTEAQIAAMTEEQRDILEDAGVL
jgi:endoglucanase